MLIFIDHNRVASDTMVFKSGVLLKEVLKWDQWSSSFSFYLIIRRNWMMNDEGWMMDVHTLTQITLHENDYIMQTYQLSHINSHYHWFSRISLCNNALTHFFSNFKQFHNSFLIPFNYSRSEHMVIYQARRNRT